MKFYEKVIYVSSWFKENGTIFKVYNFKTSKEMKKTNWEDVYPNFLVNELDNRHNKISYKDYSVQIPDLDLIFYTDNIIDMHDQIISAIKQRL